MVKMLIFSLPSFHENNGFRRENANASVIYLNSDSLVLLLLINVKRTKFYFGRENSAPQSG